MQGFEGLWPAIAQRVRELGRRLVCGVAVPMGVALLLIFGLASPASAGLTDDHYDGNIFPLYGGNGYLVPPRVTLAQSLGRGTPAVVVFYMDDSSDSKQFTTVVSTIDAFYGRNLNIIPISVDAIPVKDKYEKNEVGYYYKGYVPQTVIFDQEGKVVFDETGVVPYENIDDALRVVFDLLPRSESVQLRRRVVNELNTELVPQ
ncbi:thylakoid membrane photosystem I accumulation factor [Leptolyngbya sp. PL-A3]|nr:MULTISPECIES: thylakoid membrane photosystem I accumulation factor [unclassified Leptolyngbya]MBD1910934.1 thylakoid membrane photosystem I accumulation factor [Leptolyngbya sp. FACHB-8]MBD2158400.1 thylakoid membrane photosystem I accumulation factor [Leptolyngbya sp. FACHB-16]